MKESIEIIEELLECISWLGGDAYEVECAEQMCKNANDYLAKHKPVNVKEEKERCGNLIKLRYREMVFIHRSDPSIFIVAESKHQAKNKSGITLGNLKCVARWHDLFDGKKSITIGERLITT